jgi:glycerol-3-phosphate acyltransferase PlsX
MSKTRTEQAAGKYTGIKIAVDAFGGDNAPDEVIKGCAMAVKEYGVEILLVGDIKTIKARCSALDLSYHGMEFVEASGIITIADNPLDIRKEKADSSMGKAMALLKSGEAQAMVSGGSTAAMVVGGATNVGRIKGVKRPSIATVMPSVNGFYILIDGGANVECRPEMLAQFAVMGSIYMQLTAGMENPRVGLLNVGTENEKGRELDKAAHELIAAMDINFVGNVEGRDPTLGVCDVVVTDGFTGNVYLKTIEGMGKFIKHSLNGIFKRNAVSKIGYLLTKKGVADLAKRIDYREVGGSPLLGVKKPLIKAHGSSDAKAFKNAIRQAAECAAGNLCGKIEAYLQRNGE